MRLLPAAATAFSLAALVTVARAARADDPPAPADPADTKPPRPPLPDVPAPHALRWDEHLELGGGLAVVATPVSTDGDGKATSIRLRPNVGFHVRAGWEVFRYLWFTGYVVESDHGLTLPAGSLMLPGTLSAGMAHVYTFGARLSPTLPIGSRVRLFVTAGAGWGRVEYPSLQGTSFTVHARAANIVEVPLGVGAAFEVVPRWLRIHLELTGSIVPSQTGDALEDSGQTVIGGMIHNVGPMPRLDATIVQTLGLSLVL
jgi:opacity protein-like surface antigen